MSNHTITISWYIDDVKAAAESQGVTLTDEQAANWIDRNNSAFRNLLNAAGNEILESMSFTPDDCKPL